VSSPATGGEGRADPRAERLERPEALGGADAVEKTTYVVGEGTEPNRRPTGPYNARDARGSASLGVWIVAGVAGLIGLVYVLGILR
jgi:hypothetical protein